MVWPIYPENHPKRAGQTDPLDLNISLLNAAEEEKKGDTLSMSSVGGQHFGSESSLNEVSALMMTSVSWR